MFGNGFLRLGTVAPAFPTFIGRLRSWFRQTFVLDFQVAEILGPVPVPPKQPPLISAPPVFTRATRPEPSEKAVAKASGASEGIEMGPIIALRRLRRRQGWYDNRRRSQRLRAGEEGTSLLAAAA